MAIFSLGAQELPWWVCIHTTVPRCTYFFGPFMSPRQAEAHKVGYIEDLVEEKALEIVAHVIQCQPTALTIFDEETNLEAEVALTQA